MNKQYKLICGNSIEELKQFPDNHFDSIVTDPPYELGFMGKSWDSTGIAYNEELWSECFRVLKPGGHLIAFSGSRTYHRMAVAIENSKFEIRDQMMWIYGTGFPKSLNISKAIDKKFGAEREIIGINKTNLTVYQAIGETNTSGTINITAPSTEQAKQWDGWGTALKPAHEPMVLARKPLSEKTVAENVLKWGVGGLNIDGCKVGSEIRTTPINSLDKREDEDSLFDSLHTHIQRKRIELNTGRFPANLIHDGSEEVESVFPNSKGARSQNNNSNINIYQGQSLHNSNSTLNGFREWYNDSGSASRYFYCAKASKKDRNDGFKDGSVEDKFTTKPSANNHPTVKPTDLMAYLCRLVTPPNGLILDPFNGSGSTGKAAMRENFNYVGIDLSQEYLDISKARIDNEINKKKK